MLIPSQEMLHDKAVQKYTNMQLIVDLELCVERIDQLETFVQEHEKYSKCDWYNSKTTRFYKGSNLTLKQAKQMLKKELDLYELYQRIFEKALKEVISDCPSKQEVEYWVDSEENKSDCSR